MMFSHLMNFRFTVSSIFDGLEASPGTPASMKQHIHGLDFRAGK